jgi:hypothetical protein
MRIACTQVADMEINVMVGRHAHIDIWNEHSQPQIGISNFFFYRGVGHFRPVGHLKLKCAKRRAL